MRQVIDFAKNWTLPLAIVIGVVAHPVLGHLSPLLPGFIFSMLLITFCRIPLDEIRFRAMHFWLLVFQLAAGIVAYSLIRPFGVLLAEAALVCVIAPTGTAAAVITRKLGGSAASLTSFAILSNFGTAIAVPLFFPLIHSAKGHLGFWSAFFIIIQKVFPLLVFPFLLAMFFRRFIPALNERLGNLQEWGFYMWALALTIVMAKSVKTLIHDPASSTTMIGLCTIALVACAIQFFTGKQLGGLYGERIVGGQALGQKNGILAVWMADTYLSPVVSIAASAYIVWQNIFNSWQLWMTRREQEKITDDQKAGNLAPK